VAAKIPNYSKKEKEDDLSAKKSEGEPSVAKRRKNIWEKGLLKKRRLPDPRGAKSLRCRKKKGSIWSSRGGA